jgi:hypothetical protein
MRICIYGLLEEKREKMGRGALPVTRPSPSRIRQQLLAPAGRWSSRRGGGSTSSSTARLRQHEKSAEGEEKREERKRGLPRTGRRGAAPAPEAAVNCRAYSSGTHARKEEE